MLDPSSQPKVTILRDLLNALRIRQWIKNIYVLFPLIFSDSYHSSQMVVASLTAVFCFCMLSSATYILNDILDKEQDRYHPRKSKRPFASGRVSSKAGLACAFALMVVALLVATFVLPLHFVFYCLAYVINSIMYCLWLKHKTIMDVMIIAIGFVIRLLAGCAAIGVEPSSWLVICGFSLALALGFGKRRSELESLETPLEHRKVLLNYDVHKLDSLLAITIAICLLSYMLYTLAPETIHRHRTAKLIYTIPIVAYGLFRYLFKCQEGKGDGPTEILTKDWVFGATGVLWIVSVLIIFASR